MKDFTKRAMLSMLKELKDEGLNLSRITFFFFVRYTVKNNNVNLRVFARQQKYQANTRKLTFARCP